ncbi:MAG: hypothetical protein LBQ64_04130 [Bacteroidales bacterium]|jgi:hypothetical protein|nr:hypothetical protein [Bacteroidales bacterium]
MLNMTTYAQKKKQTNRSDTLWTHTVNTQTEQISGAKKHKLQIGGYGEISMHRFFYSNDFNRFRYPDQYKSVKSRGQFDLPHVVFYISYNFGKGWSVSSEIEFEHGGTGTTVEIEEEEFGEYEQEVEKGGEIALEQFWIQKSFFKALNLRIGHIIVPIGLTNQYHMPIEFFTVLRPEEESAILPLTWHETGISLWGEAGKWNYNVMFISGLDAERFSDRAWIKDGAVSPYEFKIANAYAGAFRVENHSVKGLRLGLSGYYGHSAKNSLKADKYSNVQGAVTIGSFEATYNDHHVIARGTVTYGHLGDSKAISLINKNSSKNSPSPRTNVASDALCYFVEAGYDFFSFSPKLKEHKFYLFGHFGYYHSMFQTEADILSNSRFERYIAAGGINYYPIPQVAVKAEFSSRIFNSPYNMENTVSLGVVYSGLFNR